jgi:uncharacterized Rmd1/YagE family protein
MRRSLLSSVPRARSSSSICSVLQSAELVVAFRACSSSSSSAFLLPPSGVCVAHHSRPAPVVLSLDDLSRQLLARSWPETVAPAAQSAAADGEELKSVTKQQLSSPAAATIVTITDVRRIMPPSPTVAAMVTPQLATAGFHHQHHHKGVGGAAVSRKYEHAAENLLLLRAELRKAGDAATPLMRDLVVFPDATLVVWGAECTEADAVVFSQLLFGDASSAQQQRNVEMEVIQYRYVNAEEEADAKQQRDPAEAAPAAESDNAAASDSSPAASSSSVAPAVEVVDGIAVIHCTPSSPSMHLNVCNLLLSSKQPRGTEAASMIDGLVGGAKGHHAAVEAVFDPALEMLPVVLALAQSTRVDAIENVVVARAARSVRTWQRHLAARGRILSRLIVPSSSLGEAARAVAAHVRSRPTLSQLRRCKARLLGVMDEVTFALELEATPKLLRIANELQRFRTSYDSVADHFELEERLEALESRIEALSESLEYLHDERHSMLTENLTILILILIFLELVVAVMQAEHSKKEEASAHHAEVKPAAAAVAEPPSKVA